MKLLVLCRLYLTYADGDQFETKVFLDLNGNIKEQVYDQFNGNLDGEIGPSWQLVNFKWRKNEQ